MTTATGVTAAATRAPTAAVGKFIEGLAELLLRFGQRRHVCLTLLQQLVQVLLLLFGNSFVVGQIVLDFLEDRRIARQPGVLDRVQVFPHLGKDGRRHLSDRKLECRVGRPGWASQLVRAGQFGLQLGAAGGFRDFAQSLQGLRLLRLRRDPRRLFEQLLRGEAAMRTQENAFPFAELQGDIGQCRSILFVPCLAQQRQVDVAVEPRVAHVLGNPLPAAPAG